MKNLNIKLAGYLLMLIPVVGSMSCQKLDESPESISTPSNFYRSVSQCEAAYTGAMNALWVTWGGYQNPVTLPDGQYDDASLDFGVSSFNDFWIWHYKAIGNINEVLKAVKAGSLEGNAEETIANTVAQGRFLRAFNYFTLVRLYGKIPYITEDTPDPVTTPLTPESRLEIADVYGLIISDLQYAVDHLGDYDGGVPGKPDKWVAKGLLAKVYITMATAPLNKTEYYAQARDIADDVIENSPYGLLDNFEDVFKTSNNRNMEIMFAFYESSDAPYMPGNVWAPSEMDGWSGGPVKILWATDIFPEQPRKHSYLLLDFTSNIYDPSAPVINWSASADGVPYVGKYNMPNLTYEQQVSGGDAGIEIKILRFADILLLYAEAANMANGGPTQKAVDRLNQIIDRANAGTGTEERAGMAMSAAAFDKKVIDERSFELCFENDRYFDVLRKRLLQEVNLPDNAQGYDDNDYLLPIPALDAKAIGQNPGYE
ncbi:RagB/SusD family nutrient uptake outer membrane protein [Agriterribacter sp.]|uniref:RagB/SusD family nutrient uptake outer membrane protein n=1 Tax=Agriterribacter sp. TaxID=2821509 RepID=UPI002BBD21B4|nr:RagB/SusD family nutrient uptake outer membrane protein [Agriterribacter sp.]HRO46715.1 RagB/SusD family nutrient uptake outer membrane protein [Agriterribacter sp.]HRQ18903.1 RagB/SusD family nutrient uptake outer membrane protein [Agriterribacter sp.]